VAGVILTSALVTLLLAPYVYRAAGPLYAAMNRIPALSRLLNRHNRGDTNREEDFSPARVLVLGSGRVGKHISDTLRAHSVPHVVVDYDTSAVAHRRRRGVPAIYGDATSTVVLEQALPNRAELAIVALPDAAATVAAVRALKQLAPDLPVIALVHRGEEMVHVRQEGADFVIHAEFEAAVALIRQALSLLDVPASEIDTSLDALRTRRYRSST
jgi:CPA2 family monovalent cation:H+ antiporter-2